jgi:dethiobiotin synthetase
MLSIADLFIVGTDTGVGKSTVSLLLMQLLFAKGYAPIYLKPFQTGCTDPYTAESDAKFIYDHTPALKGQDPAQSVIYCYPEARAPFYAARRVGDEIDLSTLRKFVEKKREKYSPLVIEGAGGLLVPVTDKVLMVDMIEELGCRPILVARAGLGTINHTLLSIEALRRRQIEPLGVVFVDTGIQHADHDLVVENREAVEIFGRFKAMGMIKYISDFCRPPEAAYGALEGLLWLPK